MMINWHYGMGIGMIVGWILIIGVLVLAVYELIVLYKDISNKKVDARNNPLGFLKESLAKGEINEEEYQNKKKILLQE